MKGDVERLEKHKWQVAHVKEKLEAPDYQLDQEMATEDRIGGASGTWVLQDPAFRKWTDRSTREHEILYISGIPGAGECENNALFLSFRRTEFAAVDLPAE